MKTVRFYGSSDDLVEVEGIEGEDEFSQYNPYNEMHHLDIHGKFIIAELGAMGANPTPRMCVYAIYDGCWHFSIGQCDEDTPLPDWPIRFSNYESGYSVVLEIDVPHSALVYLEDGRAPQ